MFEEKKDSCNYNNGCRKDEDYVKESQNAY
jgi:hypothetical protein